MIIEHDKIRDVASSPSGGEFILCEAKVWVRRHFFDTFTCLCGKKVAFTVQASEPSTSQFPGCRDLLRDYPVACHCVPVEGGNAWRLGIAGDGFLCGDCLSRYDEMVDDFIASFPSPEKEKK